MPKGVYPRTSIMKRNGHRFRVDGWNPKRKAPGEAALNKLWLTYTTNATNRHVEWSLTREDFLELISQNCHYCGLPPSRVEDAYFGPPLIWTGIDRVDNQIGYTKGNCVPACYDCNRAKSDLSYEAFISWIKRIAAYDESRQSREVGISVCSR